MYPLFLENYQNHQVFFVNNVYGCLNNMDEISASIFNNAIAERFHPLFDWGSTESIQVVFWVHEYLSRYIDAGKSLIDLGCGSGKHTYQVELLGINTYGIDISEKMIEYALCNKLKYNSKSIFIVGSYYSLPFTSNVFDYALFPKNIIECSIREFEIITNEVYRILNKDGQFIILLKENHYIEENKENLIHMNNVKIDGIGEFSYPSYYWNTKMIERITQGKFKLIVNDCIDDKKRTVLLIAKKY